MIWNYQILMSEKNKSRSRERSRQKNRNREKYHKRSQKSRSNSKERDHKKDQLKRVKQKPKINSFLLTDMIMQQKRSNKRMDEQEIKRATKKLKNDFNETIQAVTMSSYLSDQSLRRKKVLQEECQKCKKYTCDLENCKMSFQSVEQLQKHIEKHKYENMN